MLCAHYARRRAEEEEPNEKEHSKECWEAVDPVLEDIHWSHVTATDILGRTVRVHVLEDIQANHVTGYGIYADPEEWIPDIACSEAQEMTRRFWAGREDVDLILLQEHFVRDFLDHEAQCPALQEPNAFVKILEGVTVV